MSQSLFTQDLGNIERSQSSKIYKGSRDDGKVRVTVGGQALNPRFDLRNHSPTGFEWGYGGSGPAQLALAILADHLDDEQATSLYQEFKRNVVAGLPRNGWTLRTWEIDRAIARMKAGKQ